MIVDSRGPRFSAAIAAVVLAVVVVTGSGWLLLAGWAGWLLSAGWPSPEELLLPGWPSPWDSDT